MGQRTIYLDYAAATPLDERVLAAMEPYFTEKFYNPSAIYTPAREVKSDYEDARHALAQVLGGKQHEVIITAGATESINLAVNGVIKRYGGTAVVSAIEHAAVIAAGARYGSGTVMPDSRGVISPSEVQKAITPETVLVSVGYVNNELGTVQSLKDIAAVIDNERQQRLARGNDRPIFLHTDASQAVGLLDISVSRLGVDMMTLNSGKCYGPKQVGLLWARAGIELAPLIYGGGQESGLRSGSENVAGAIGFAKAVEIACRSRKTESYRIAGLRDELQKQLAAHLPGMVANGHQKRRAAHILHISFGNVDGERLVYALSERGVMVATGSACSASHGSRSHVLTAIGLADDMADSSLRISLGRETTVDDIDEAARHIVEAVKQETGK